MKKSCISKSSKFSSYQIIVILQTALVGSSFLFLPRQVAQTAGNDGIIILLIAGLISWITIYMLSRLVKRFPGESIVDYTPHILGRQANDLSGKLLSIPIFLLLGINLLLMVAATSRLFGEAVAVTLLDKTPLEIILLTLIFVTAIAAGSKPVVVARLNEIVYPLMLIPVILVMVGMFMRGKVMNMLPLLQADWTQIMHSIPYMAFFFSGFNILFIFSKYYSKPDKSLKAHTVGMLAVTFIYFIIYIASLSVFGVTELKLMFSPPLEVVKDISNPNLFIERSDTAIMALYVGTIFVAMTNSYSAFTMMIKDLFKLSDRGRRWFPIYFIPIVFMLAYYPSNFVEMNILVPKLGLFTFVTTLFIVLLLLTIAVIRNQKGGVVDEEIKSNS